MKPPKRYTVADIKECIDILRSDKNLSQEKIDGMDFLIAALDTFEEFNDKPEDEKSAIFRGSHKWWDREKAIEKIAAQEAKEARKKEKIGEVGEVGWFNYHRRL